MAIAATYFTTATSITSSTAIYTTGTTYNRDLVITNDGPSLAYVTLGASSTGAAAATGFAVPTGGSVILTQCQVPTSGIIYAFSGGTASVSLGWASLVTYI